MLGDCGTKCKYLNECVDMWVNGVLGIVRDLLITHQISVSTGNQFLLQQDGYQSVMDNYVVKWLRSKR